MSDSTFMWCTSLLSLMELVSYEEKQTPIVISQCTVFFTLVTLRFSKKRKSPRNSESIRIISANQQEIVCQCRDMWEATSFSDFEQRWKKNMDMRWRSSWCRREQRETCVGERISMTSGTMSNHWCSIPHPKKSLWWVYCTCELCAYVVKLKAWSHHHACVNKQSVKLP
jgi:hypothetical protein